MIKAAADYAARHAVLSGRSVEAADQSPLADELRQEFLARIAHWEDIYFNGGEKVVVSTNPKKTMRMIEIIDQMLDEAAGRRRRRS